MAEITYQIAMTPELTALLAKTRSALGEAVILQERALLIERAARHLQASWRQDHCDIPDDFQPLFDILDARVPA